MTEKINNFDVIITGAGPAGCSCAMMLADSGLKIAIVDKAKFPREKVCGDALGTDVVNQLNKLPEKLKARFDELQGKLPVYGVRISSPDSNYFDLEFAEGENGDPPGFVLNRTKFDQLLVDFLDEYKNVQLIENCKVSEIRTSDHDIRLTTNKGGFTSKIAIGAEGINSIFAKHLTGLKREGKHMCICVRTYYENIEPINKKDFIELHFIKDLLPCYMWIFPTADNRYNVGIGMMQSIINKKGTNLKDKFYEIINNHPAIAPRFKNANQIGKLQGGNIPLGSKKRKLSGNRFLLAGDAASLVDPFLGEGVGNAIRSGRLAADHIKKCFDRNDFSMNFNETYDTSVYKMMWSELRTNYTLQKLVGKHRMFNRVVKKANRNPAVKEVIKGAAQHEDMKKVLSSPGFIFKLLFR